MTNPKFYFGETIQVTGKLLRTRPDSKTRNWVVKSSPPRNAIFLGYRTLYDGEIKWEFDSDFDSGNSYTYFKHSKTHKAALICTKGRKPEYAFLDMIEKLS